MSDTLKCPDDKPRKCEECAKWPCPDFTAWAHGTRHHSNETGMDYANRVDPRDYEHENHHREKCL